MIHDPALKYMNHKREVAGKWWKCNPISERNIVVVLFGTLKVQSFILAEVSDCGLLIVVTSSTFLK